MRSMSQLLSLLTILLVPMLCQRAAMAGPPFFTDDPEPVDYKHGEFYAAFSMLSDRNEVTGTFPQFEFNYGPRSEFQLHLVAPVSFNHQAQGASSYGYGDTEAGLKYRFVRETRWIPQIGTFPLLELPTGDSRSGLGNGKAQLFLPIWFQKSWGGWTTYGGGGYWINPGTGNENWTFLGWELQRTMSKELIIGAEIFHRTPDKIGAQGSLGFNAGGFFNFNDSHHLLFSAGADMSGPRHTTVYLAYQWTF